jgi:hypothetical protein
MTRRRKSLGDQLRECGVVSALCSAASYLSFIVKVNQSPKSSQETSVVDVRLILHNDVVGAPGISEPGSQESLVAMQSHPTCVLVDKLTGGHCSGCQFTDSS